MMRRLTGFKDSLVENSIVFGLDRSQLHVVYWRSNDPESLDAHSLDNCPGPAACPCLTVDQ